MRNSRYREALTFLWLIWTVFVLYGSLAPGDDLPTGWWTKIPYFDKGVHFCFYAGEASLSLLLFRPRGWKRWALLAVVVAASAGIEYLQGAYFDRSSDFWDGMANAVGAISALGLAPVLHRWVLEPVFGSDPRAKRQKSES